MKSTLLTAFVILGVSSFAGAVANTIRRTPMTWIRAERPGANNAAPEAPMPQTTARPHDARADEPIATPQSSIVAPAKPESAKVESAGGPRADEILALLAAGSARFVDAREEREFAPGHLRGAINIPASAIYDNIAKLLSEVPTSTKIVVYCGGGHCEASHHVTEALQNDFHFENVVIYTNGWEEIEKVAGFKPYIEGPSQ